MKITRFNLNKTIICFFILGSICWLTIAQASLKEIKAYKEAFPESKPKCIHCHTDEKPKKESGQHELNDYGKAIKTTQDKEEATAETFKKVGPVENFKK